MATEEKKLIIQERDWLNYLKRVAKGFINRLYERRALFPRRKRNCRKLTLGRLHYLRDTEL